ncbi:MAG: tail fiber domain-containing protein, partial [Calditrichaceae bacterium]
WSTISDSTKKENFKQVDGEEFLNKISLFKLTSWNYKGQDPANYRHYGPMAQDFYAAFGNDGIGTIGNDTTLASADFDGINFIAIQALEKRTTDLKSENEKLKSELSELKSELAFLKSLLQKLADKSDNNAAETKKLAQK